MNTMAEMIYREAQRLPDDLARQVYEFIVFVEKRHGIEAKPENLPAQDWQPFFNRFTRTVLDAQPLNRDELYADRLR